MNVELTISLASKTVGHIMPLRTVKGLSFASFKGHREDSWNSTYELGVHLQATGALIRLLIIPLVLLCLDCEWRVHHLWRAAQRALSDAQLLHNKAAFEVTFFSLSCNSTIK